MERFMPSGGEHYPADVVGAARGMPGAGILAWLTGDHLHPPMLADETMWSDGRQWQDGARRYVIELGRAAGLRPGDRVLDLGCGVCGPARTLVDTFDVTVDAVTTSQAHAETSRAINTLSSVYSDRINVFWVAGAANWPDRVYDTVWSLNMMYQVPDHQEVYGRIFDHLKPGGLLVVDDWMASDAITENDLRKFWYHFSFRNLIKMSRIEPELLAVGFAPISTLLDRGDVARGPMMRYFDAVMTEQFMPNLSAYWPDNQGPISGRQMALDFAAAVGVTLELYEARKLTYRSIITKKLEA
jgi:SAM-dependent methyltransferase